MPLPDEPFTEVLEALWSVLEAQPDVTAIVATRNMIKLSEGNDRVQKMKHTYADLPEITIQPFGGSLNYHHSSMNVQVIQRYRIMFKDGNLLVDASFFPLKWALIKALSSLDNDLGLTYVSSVEVEDGLDQLSDEKHPGWTSGIDIVVQMLFSRTEMKA